VSGIQSLTDPAVPCTLRQLAEAAYELGRSGQDFQAWWSRLVATQLTNPAIQGGEER
jgi:hypothetical protein